MEIVNMERFIILVCFSVVASVVNAESVVRLDCTGSKPDGTTKTIDFDYSPDAGWAQYSIARVSGAVSDTQVEYMRMFGVNFETGEFWHGSVGGGPRYIGTCKERLRWNK
jgi:hypothetical protein